MPIPNTGAVPDVATATLIASDWGNAIGAASRGRVVQRFNSLAERDASITAPVAGMLCYVLATDAFYGYRTATGWAALVVPNLYYARAYRNGGFTLASGPIPLDAANFDPSLCFNANAGKFTCPVAGFYSVSGAVSVNSTNTAQVLVATLTKNGGLNTNGALAASTAPAQVITSAFTDLLSCASGDVLAVNVGYNPASLAGAVGSPYTFLAVQFLHS